MLGSAKCKVHEFLIVTLYDSSIIFAVWMLVWSKSPNSLPGFVRIWNPPGFRFARTHMEEKWIYSILDALYIYNVHVYMIHDIIYENITRGTWHRHGWTDRQSVQPYALQIQNSTSESSTRFRCNDATQAEAPCRNLAARTKLNQKTNMQNPAN